MKPLLILLCLVTGCASTTRLATRKCPVPTTAVLGDFFVGVAALGVSAIKFNAGKTGESVGYSALGGGLMIGSFVSELSCLKK